MPRVDVHLEKCCHHPVSSQHHQEVHHHFLLPYDCGSVNKRFLSNVPSPIPLPIHGFFEDADGYKTKYLVPGKNWAPSLPLSFHLVWPLASSQMLDLSLFLTMSSMGTSMKPARVGFYMPSSMRWRRRGTRGLR